MTDEKKESPPQKKDTQEDLNQIFEDRFIFEEGAYRAYVTDEKKESPPKKDTQEDLNQIFEDRFIFEEGAYRGM